MKFMMLVPSICAVNSIKIRMDRNFQLTGIGAKLLTDVDPNPENYVCAGIINTHTQQIGTLVRLEPNKQAKVGIILN